MQRGSKARYMQHDVTEPGKLVPEGVEARVPYRGNLASTVHQLTGGLRSGMGYCGCRNLDEFRTRAEFIRITAASVAESHPHSITITEEPPNYQMPR
jgi:IMP dehydrogenase